MEPLITTYSPRDRNSVAELQQLLWQGGRDGNIRYLEWKYVQNPYLDDRYLLLAWANDTLVGMIGAFGASWEIPDSAQMMLPCLSDTVIAASHRGSSLFRLMLNVLTERMAGDGVPWLLDFGDQPAGPAMLMRGWKPIGPWAIARTGPRQAAHASNHGLLSGDLERVGPRSGLHLKFADTMSPVAVADVIAKAQPTDRVRHVRDATYLEWRFRNPLARYYHLSAGGDAMAGYLLAHRTLVDDLLVDTPTTIMDCEAIADEVWADLVEAALSQLPGREVLMWARDLSPSRLSLLTRMGMRIQVPTGRLTADVDFPNLLICPTGAPCASPTLSRLSDASLWDLRAICGRSWR